MVWSLETATARINVSSCFYFPIPVILVLNVFYLRYNLFGLSVTLGFKFQLPHKVEGFECYGTFKCIGDQLTNSVLSSAACEKSKEYCALRLALKC
jgi:hypothetical protein